MIMKYKNLQFLKNPSHLEMNSRRQVSQSGVIAGKTAVSGICEEPTVIKASGVLYDGGEKWCLSMKNLMSDGKSGWLFSPGAPPVMAYLTSFSYRRDSGKNEICYSAEFTEDCNSRRYEARLKYTYALEGENAFDIAHRCNITVDALEELNSFVSPFEINENDRVVIR